jgi:hypothetical protein
VNVCVCVCVSVYVSVCVCVCVCVCETNFLPHHFSSLYVLLGADVTYVNIKHKNVLSNITYLWYGIFRSNCCSENVFLYSKILTDGSDTCSLDLVLRYVLGTVIWCSQEG